MVQVIDGEGAVAGRIASYSAKEALKGEEIAILNCEKAIITGNKRRIFEKYKRISELGNQFKGPFLSRMPDRFVRRVIRGMLPYKHGKGKDAFKRIMCYMSVPIQFNDKKMETIKEADISRVKSLKYTTVGEICKLLRGK